MRAPLTHEGRHYKCEDLKFLRCSIDRYTEKESISQRKRVI